MRRNTFIIIGLIFILLSLSACNNQNEKSQDSFLLELKGMTQKEVNKILGSSSGALLGAHGEVYLLENKTKVTIYYDNSEKVQHLSASDNEEEIAMKDALTCIKDATQEEVHKTLGAPSNALHGERGDVYILENKTKITIYYNNDGMVKKILVTNKEDEVTFTSAYRDKTTPASWCQWHQPVIRNKQKGLSGNR